MSDIVEDDFLVVNPKDVDSIINARKNGKTPLDEIRINHFIDQIKEGKSLPPIVLFKNKSIKDGMHRYMAHKILDKEYINIIMDSPLQKILENINSTLNNPIDVKLPNMFKPTGEKRKSASGIDGKYFKSQDNVSGSMISQQDREKSTPEGRAKGDLDKSTTGDVRIFSGKEFDEMLNKSGDRSLNLSDGQEKALNSKKANYLVKRLPDGRVRVRKVKGDQS